MKKKEYIIVQRSRFAYVRKHYNAEKQLVRMESYDSDTDHCFFIWQFFYDEQGRKVRETHDVDNERERSHTETVISYEDDDVMVCESITHYDFSSLGKRDERCVERYSGTAMMQETYDLETGELRSVQDFDPYEDFFREITYRPDGSVCVDYDDDVWESNSP